jgi:hypothetical protein
MTRETLLGLADRCEQATGPDRELDRLIVLSLGADIERIPGSAADGSQDGFVDRKGVLPKGFAYTASLDSAMTLVPEGAGFKLASVSFEKWAQVVREDKLPDGTAIISGGSSAKAATLPLAMCAAALKTRASL